MNEPENSGPKLAKAKSPGKSFKIKNPANLTAEEVQSYFPQAVNYYQGRGDIENLREFLAQMQKFQYKPAVQLLLQIELETRLRTFIEALIRYMAFIFIQEKIEDTDRDFIKKIFEFAISGEMFNPLEAGKINPKYLEMPEKKLVDELFWERNSLNKRPDLISALYYKLGLRLELENEHFPVVQEEQERP